MNQVSTTEISELLFPFQYSRERNIFSPSWPCSDTHRQVRSFMGMGWCVDVEIQAVLRHRHGRHNQIHRLCKVWFHYISLWTPGEHGRQLVPDMGWSKLNLRPNCLSGTFHDFLRTSEVPSYQGKGHQFWGSGDGAILLGRPLVG